GRTAAPRRGAIDRQSGGGQDHARQGNRARARRGGARRCVQPDVHFDPRVRAGAKRVPHRSLPAGRSAAGGHARVGRDLRPRRAGADRVGRALSPTDAGGAHGDLHPARRKRRKGNRSRTTHMTKQPWALILGASSGFGEAVAVELARAGMNIFGVHMDRRDKLPHVAEVRERIGAAGREGEVFNFKAADEDKRRECVEQIRGRLTGTGTLRVLMHSLAWGALKPLAGAEVVANKKQIESTADIMGHSLVYWVQECLLAGLFDKGARIFAMTSSGGTRAIPDYGPVSAAKAILEAHIRQLALELAPAGITA